MMPEVARKRSSEGPRPLEIFAYFLGDSSPIGLAPPSQFGDLRFQDAKVVFERHSPLAAQLDALLEIPARLFLLALQEPGVSPPGVS